MKIFRLTIGNPILICVFILLLFAAEVIGATYYVAPNGKDSNRGTKSAPFRNIQKAASVVNPGDTVIVKDGTYTDNNSDNWVVRIKRSGTSSNPITFRAENRHKAVIDGNNNRTGYGIDINASWIVIEGFEIKDINTIAIWLRADSDDRNHDVVIKRCYIHDIGRVRYTGDNGKVGIYSSGHFYNSTITQNKFETIGRANADDNCEHCNRHDHCLYLRGLYHTVSNNIFIDAPGGWYITARGNQLNESGRPSHTIVNNVFHDVANCDDIRKEAIDIGLNRGDKPAKVVVIENNIFGYSSTCVNSSHTVFVGVNADKVYFRNNVSAEKGALRIKKGYSVNTYISNNTMGKDPSSYELKDWDNHNFEPTASSSSIIDQGLATNAPSVDYNGKARPQEGGHDIGAFEYNDLNWNVDAPPPEPPNNLRVVQ
jgi:hypothetical protein